MNNSDNRETYTTAKDFLESLFTNELNNPSEYDQEIVSLIKRIVMDEKVKTKAGKRIAEEVILLVKSRLEQELK